MIKMYINTFTFYYVALNDTNHIRILKCIIKNGFVST